MEKPSYGTLNFSVSFNPTAGFPMDNRSYFESHSEALAAAQTADKAGTTNSKYYFGQPIYVVEDGIATEYIIQPNRTLRSSGTCYNVGSGLILDTATNTISVDVAHDAEKDNTRPITSAAVYTKIGNINSLLDTI